MAGVIEISDLKVRYGANDVLKGFDLTISAGMVLAVVGPSGCGKTTLLRCLNRMAAASGKVSGLIQLDGEDVYRMDPILLRRRVGMVFQKPNPFPMSIRDNVLYGVRAQGGHKKAAYPAIVEAALTRAVLWHEVKARLNDSALTLSLGQQQRLCIARALAVEPEVILMDEPAASLDPTSTAELEDSIMQMKGDYTVVIVTHDIVEARRVSDHTAYLSEGHVVEFGTTDQMFSNPGRHETRAYLRDRTLEAAPA